RECTAEVPSEPAPRAVCEARSGTARRRGVASEAGVAPPDGVTAAPVERVVAELPRPLVELALWVADYYGSTPGRALALVAPVQRKPRGERAQPADRDALAGEAAPACRREAQHATLTRSGQQRRAKHSTD